jgi:phenylalanyl-tRNA synthetase alpha chain
MDLSGLSLAKNEIKAELLTVNSLADAEALRVKFLGKNGVLKKLTSELAALSTEDKKQAGILINEIKQDVEQKLAEITKKLTTETKTDSLDAFIKTLPGRKPEIGHLHVTTQAIREIVEVFKPLGFTRVRYPEIDWEYYAFEALNIPATHPARDE